MKGSSNRLDLQSLSEDTFEQIKYDLIKTDVKRTKAKWTGLSTEKLKRLLSADPRTMMNAFTKQELIVCASNFESHIENI